MTGSTPGGCGSTDGELAVALANELPSVGDPKPTTVPGADCPAGTTSSAAVSVTDNGAHGVIIALVGLMFWQGQKTPKLALDLAGGTTVTLTAEPSKPGAKIGDAEMSQAISIMRERVNGLGVSEPVIQVRGSNQIVVELAGATDPEEATRIVQKTALLEIIDTNGQFLPAGTIVNTTLGDSQSVNGDDATPASSPVGSPAASPVGSPLASPVGSPLASPVASPVAAPTVEPTSTSGDVYTTIVSGGDLKNAFVTTDQLSSIAVGFELKGDKE